MPDETAPDQIPPGFKLRHTLRGYMSVIFRIAWSPDGQMLAVLSKNGVLQLWDIETGRISHTLKAHYESVLSMAWSPDGQMLASGHRDGTIRLRETGTWQLCRVLKGHSEL